MAGRAWTSATPPPATMPSSSAARVAESESSTRCCFSFSSTPVAAPTWITATLPDSRAIRGLQAVLVVLVLRPLELVLQLVDPAPPPRLRADAADDGGGGFGDGDPPDLAELLQTVTSPG